LEKIKLKYIFWFAYYNLESPSVRYRAKYPLDFAKENLNISSILVIPGYSPKNIFNFLIAFLSALIFSEKKSIIVIQRVRSNFIYSNLLKLLVLLKKGNTVYDLDDADYLEHKPNTINYFARNCNAISAGSVEISNYFKQLNKNIFHITSPILDLGIVKHERNKLFSIGWIGGYGWGHKNSLLKFIFPAIRNLRFDCQLTLIGITNNNDEKDVIEYFQNNFYLKLIIPRNIDWKNEIDLQNRIKDFDVGIATLYEHPVQLAKSGIKAKQYMNNGVPVLCNNLPENNKVVIDGYNGFICNTITDFTQKFNDFKEMSDKQYWQYSLNARNSVVNFNHIKYFNELEELINNA
jgi:glycosyltransferase involved in cell wall biosynthesis